MPVDRARRIFDWSVGMAKDVSREWSADRVGGLSAEIAFFALLGLFPLVIVMAAALGSFDSLIGAHAASQVENWLLDRISTTFGADNSLASTVSDLFDGSNAGALTTGLVFSIYAASRGFIAVVGALDVAYGYKTTRGWLATRLVGFGLTVASVMVAAVVMLMAVVGPLFGLGGGISNRLGAGHGFVVVWDLARWPLVAVMLVVWSATVYHVAPSHRTPWRSELPGASIATVWWVIVSLGFNRYLAAASSGANAVFGLLGGALSIMFWLYLMAMGLLVGAEINALLAVKDGKSIAVERRSPHLPMGRHKG